IKSYVNKNLMLGASYNFNFKPWVFEPFKKAKLNSKYLRLIKDFNINPVPKTLSINSRINRNYNSQQSRNLIEGLLAQPVLKQRRFMFDWDYTVGFDLTKSLQFNFTANTNHIYDSFGRNEDLEIFDKVFDFGRKNHYHQTLNGTYKIPLDKIPFLNFVTADYGYSADFDWQSASKSPIFENGVQVATIEDRVGNMIQNSNTHRLNANFDFGRFYNNIGLKKLLLKGARKSVKGNHKLKNGASFGDKFMKATYDVLTSLKRAKVSYSQTNGMLMQGYKPSVGFLGRNSYNGQLAPTLGFVFGSQTDILNTAIENNWLVSRQKSDEYFNQNYGRTEVTKVNYNLSVKPLKTLTIDFTGNSIKTSALTSQIDVIDTGNGLIQNPEIQTFETGNYSSSHFMLWTMFTNNNTLFDR
ncbi:MAG: cell surface protein SprA, partial [Polaribacter sp.]